MDEPNATRVTATPVEVKTRGEQALHISLRISTASSARHITGLLLEILSKRDHQVDSIRVRKHEPLLASFDRSAHLAAPRVD